jgi:hypothetical protein
LSLGTGRNGYFGGNRVGGGRLRENGAGVDRDMFTECGLREDGFC